MNTNSRLWVLTPEQSSEEEGRISNWLWKAARKENTQDHSPESPLRSPLWVSICLMPSSESGTASVASLCAFPGLI